MNARRGAAMFAATLLFAGCTTVPEPAVPPQGAAFNQGQMSMETTAPEPSVSTTWTASPSIRPDPVDIYANDRPGMLSPVVKDLPTRVYVPNSGSSTLDEIDPTTMQIVRSFGVGKNPQHVVPSWDLKTLYVASDEGNSLTPIDPMTGDPGPAIPVDDPYNLYFTTDGASAIVVAERLERLDFRDPHTFALQRSLPVPCKGVDHLDFSADGSYLVASCEFAATLIKVRLTGPGSPSLEGAPLLLRPGAKPQDVKLSPDGSTLYVADMVGGGVWDVDGQSMAVRRFLTTGAGAHGLYVSRDSTSMFVTNRDAGSVSVLDFASREVRATWKIPGQASPDMGGISADGATLWLAGRRHGEIYAIDTTSGALKGRITVGKEPHGLSIYPQPGTYSLGHTGIFR